MKKSDTYKLSSSVTKIMIMFLLLMSSVNALAKVGVQQVAADSASIIHEEKFIQVNGIEQWVTIHGNSTKPVILFLHGGPGSPISPFSATLYKDWEQEFIIVQWDQRGTGKTFGRNAPEELTSEYLKANPLTVEQMVSDGIELTAYLIQRLTKKRIILFGTSWGSVLGVKMATERPDLFYAYVGHSQITDPADDLPLYHKVYDLAEKKQDTASLAILNTIGLPPYTEARNFGKLLGIVKKYERLNSTQAPDTWFVVPPEYATSKDNQHRSDGDDYSFVNYVGDKRLGITAMRATINLLKENTGFKIPVYFIQGAEDLLTPPEATKKYFNSIKAPVKKYHLLPKSAHGFNSSVLEMQYKVFKAIKTQ